MSNIWFIGATAEVPKVLLSDWEKSFSYCGRNTGNMFIGRAVQKQLKYESAGFGYSISPEKLENDYQHIVIAASNFLHHKFDFGSMADFIEKTTLPVTMIGLGAQSPDVGLDAKKIPDGTMRLLSIVSERSKSISVRGYYTAQVLNNLGFKNIRVTGCPAIYSNCIDDLKIDTKDFSEVKDIVINGSRNVTEHSFDPIAAKVVESELISYAVKNKVDFVLQNETEEIEILNNKTITLKRIDSILTRLGCSVKSKTYLSYIKKHGKVFFEIKDWLDFIKNKDFSFGTRFHGNIAALLSGVPAVVIVHDSRTREMCELLHMPHIHVNKLQALSVRNLYEGANFDEFRLAYNSMFAKYIEFLNENNLPHNLQWKRNQYLGGLIKYNFSEVV